MNSCHCSLIIGILCVYWMRVESMQQHMNDTPAMEQPFVDILVSDYFKIEQNLWMMIENRADNVLLQVYRTHGCFFNQTISESASGVMMRDLVPGMGDVVQIAVNLNATAELGYNHLREQELDQKSITDYANYSLKILKNASDLFDMTMKASFWESIINHLSVCHGHGDTVQSSHQVVFDFYRDIQSGLLKSYVTSQMSYMILAYYNSGKSYQEESDILRSTFETRFKHIREIAKYHLQSSRREVWKCDAANNNANSWYTEVTNFLQGIVDNEANLNADGSCTSICPVYRETRHYHCQTGSLCDGDVNVYEATKCNGIVRHCQEIDNSDVNICETDEPNRHYNFIEYSDGRTAGYANGMCQGRLTAQSWIRWFVKCSNCFCLCDDVNNKESDRYFSLREVVSNIADNKIVTGVTITKLNGVFHLAISERNLLPFGQAEVMPPYPFTETWKTADNIFNGGGGGGGGDDAGDHYTLTYANRSINLDYVTAPKDHLVSGVRFRIVDGHITLEIRATEFDFSTGRLKNQENSLWVSNPNCGKVKIELVKRNNPATSYVLSAMNEIPNGFIEFGPTDYWSDISQLTVPFIDTQRVEPYLPVALSGVGLYHKTSNASGGFIATKLIVYDFEPYVQVN